MWETCDLDPSVSLSIKDLLKTSVLGELAFNIPPQGVFSDQSFIS